MHVQVDPRGGPASRLFDLTIRHHPPELYQPQYLSGMTEHDLRDIVFELERRTAMGECCPGTEGEHTCANAPGHADPHLCRACPWTWRRA